VSTEFPVVELEFLLPSGAPGDLGRDDCMRLTIERAFPLPSTGAFADLLAAIDGAPSRSETAASIGNLSAKPSTSG
jgi:hypothetical protein